MRLFILMPILLVSGCVSVAKSGDAICAATVQGRAEHAAALAKTPDDMAAVSGANLIETIDAACGRE